VRFAILGRSRDGRTAFVRHAAILLSTADRPLSGRLLPKTTPLHSVPFVLLDVRRLLPQADSLRAVLASVRIVR
jgi:hypothetical protein